MSLHVEFGWEISLSREASDTSRKDAKLHVKEGCMHWSLTCLHVVRSLSPSFVDLVAVLVSNCRRCLIYTSGSSKSSSAWCCGEVSNAAHWNPAVDHLRPMVAQFLVSSFFLCAQDLFSPSTRTNEHLPTQCRLVAVGHPKAVRWLEACMQGRGGRARVELRNELPFSASRWPNARPLIHLASCATGHDALQPPHVLSCIRWACVWPFVKLHLSLGDSTAVNTIMIHLLRPARSSRCGTWGTPQIFLGKGNLPKPPLQLAADRAIARIKSNFNSTPGPVRSSC